MSSYSLTLETTLCLSSSENPRPDSNPRCERREWTVEGSFHARLRGTCSTDEDTWNFDSEVQRDPFRLYCT